MLYECHCLKRKNYAFDGRLLAEYDGYGACLREYIYIGAKMVAEHQPTTDNYYYYTTDQVNSTRVVTDETGRVVYSAVHDPYGGVQQTWVNTFNPGWKFPGKEQDTESSLYYFGARYYDPALYRFLSPDPVIPADRAVYNPQRWNLYGYCLNNPLNLIDLDGRWGRYVHYYMTYQLALKVGLPEKIAERIAKANHGVDDNELATGSLVLWGYRNHFPRRSDLNRAYEIAYTTLSPEKLGQALHTIQDYFSHMLYCNRLFGGHFIESFEAWISADPMNDPDYTFRDLELLSEMLETTERILEDYRNRLVTAIFNAIVTILPIIFISPVI